MLNINEKELIEIKKEIQNNQKTMKNKIQI